MTETALPTNVGSGTVVGKFVTSQRGTGGGPVEVAAAGTITFTPSPLYMTDPGAVPKLFIVPRPIVVTLDAGGAFSVQLVATDDVDLNPTGWTYMVSFQLNGIKLPSFAIHVPEGSTVDLVDEVPVASSGGTLIVRGFGVPDVSFATPGQVVTWDGADAVWDDPTGGSGGMPDATGVADGEVLTAQGGAAEWDPLTASQISNFNTAADARIPAATHAAGSKATPVDADEVPLTDSAASFGLKRLTWSNLKAVLAAAAQTLTNKDLSSGTNTFPTFNQSTTGNAATATKLATARAIDGVNFDGSAAITVLPTASHAATSKTAPVDADELPMVDSAASFGLKKLTWANLKATMKAALTKADVGLGSADNTADSTKAVLSATKLTTARNISGVSFDGTADIAVVAPATHAATSKTTPVNADEIPMADSAASFAIKKLTWSNLVTAVTTALAPLFNSKPDAIRWDGTGAQPARPITDSSTPVFYISPVQPTGGGTVGGAGNAVDGLDVWLVSES